MQSTKEVMKDCTLENGAIVAANSTKKYYPATAKNYFYVWPRDAAYACLAADKMGNKDMQKNFFIWCLDYAEGFSETGLFYEKYYPNGLKALMNFQPDQTGTVLYAACNFCKTSSSKEIDDEIYKLIRTAANGICSVWNETCFTIRTADLWEERTCFPHLEENFSYTLAACIQGLRSAYETLGNPKWLETSESMKNRLEAHFDGFFVRSFGKLVDKRIDASILGLIYPFEVYEAADNRIIATVNRIEDHLIADGGVHRYENDEYDGWMCNGVHMKKGSGAWPLLNFWLSTYFSIKGDRAKAEGCFNWVMDQIGDNPYIPEQIFNNNLQVSISPLLWSHVMFYLAARQLDVVHGHNNP